jgi:hypothetical protein
MTTVSRHARVVRTRQLDRSSTTSVTDFSGIPAQYARACPKRQRADQAVPGTIHPALVGSNPSGGTRTECPFWSACTRSEMPDVGDRDRHFLRS